MEDPAVVPRPVAPPAARVPEVLPAVPELRAAQAAGVSPAARAEPRVRLVQAVPRAPQGVPEPLGVPAPVARAPAGPMWRHIA